MELAAFWSLIERSRRNSEDCSSQAETLAQLLSKLEPDEIAAFDRHFRGHMRAIYRSDLWAIAYIINGGCSDDCFEYFRGWVIAQGEGFFEAVARSPVYAASRAGEGGDVECEDILYVAATVYESKTGSHLPVLVDEAQLVLQGELWDEDDLERLYPDLYQRFLS